MGFTKIDNKLLEHIIREDLTSAELKVILAVIRYTNGFNREFAVLSYSFIEKMSDISKRHIMRIVKKLKDRNIIKIKYTKGKPNMMAVDKSFFTSDTDVTADTDDIQSATCMSPQSVTHMSYKKENNINKNNKEIYYKSSNHIVPTPKATKFNNFTQSSSIDYKKFEMEALKRRLARTGDVPDE